MIKNNTSWECMPMYWPGGGRLTLRVNYSTVQYSTVQYSTVQYITVQYSFMSKVWSDWDLVVGTFFLSAAVMRSCGHKLMGTYMNREEEEIYNILYKKKEINDKIPKLSEPSV